MKSEMCNCVVVRDAVLKNCWLELWNVRPHFGRSVMRTREGRAAASGFSELNGLSFWPSRIGSVNCGQRHANATTRTTGRYLNDGGSFESGFKMHAFQTGVAFSSHHHSENIRWSSRPRPVNRLQATSQPRRVMRGGSKSDALGSKGTGQTRPTGKAFAFTKGTVNKQQYQEYLQSDHWLNFKIKKGALAKWCWCCHVRPDPSNFHHVRYKQIFDVSTKDLRLLCEDCHHFYHAIKSENPRRGEGSIWAQVKRLRHRMKMDAVKARM